MTSTNLLPAPSTTREAGARRAAVVVLLWLEAGLLALAVPVTLLMLFAAAWEGGDVEWKHRLIAWAPTGLLGEVMAVPLMTVAAVSIRRGGQYGDRLAWSAVGATALLATGWAHVGIEHTPPQSNAGFDVAVWLIWTLPALTAGLLHAAARGIGT